jgi:hypothetical protein
LDNVVSMLRHANNASKSERVRAWNEDSARANVPLLRKATAAGAEGSTAADTAGRTPAA